MSTGKQQNDTLVLHTSKVIKTSPDNANRGDLRSGDGRRNKNRGGKGGKRRGGGGRNRNSLKQQDQQWMDALMGPYPIVQPGECVVLAVSRMFVYSSEGGRRSLQFTLKLEFVAAGKIELASWSNRDHFQRVSSGDVKA